jgi:hypothetical protein
MDLVEGMAPSETEKVMYRVRAGQYGITGHSTSYSPHCCARESVKKKILDDWDNLNRLDNY